MLASLESSTARFPVLMTATFVALIAGLTLAAPQLTGLEPPGPRVLSPFGGARLTILGRDLPGNTAGTRAGAIAACATYEVRVGTTRICASIDASACDVGKVVCVVRALDTVAPSEISSAPTLIVGTTTVAFEQALQSQNTITLRPLATVPAPIAPSLRVLQRQASAALLFNLSSALVGTADVLLEAHVLQNGSTTDVVVRCVSIAALAANIRRCVFTEDYPAGVYEVRLMIAHVGLTQPSVVQLFPLICDHVAASFIRAGAGSSHTIRGAGFRGILDAGVMTQLRVDDSDCLPSAFGSRPGEFTCDLTRAMWLNGSRTMGTYAVLPFQPGLSFDSPTGDVPRNMFERVAGDGLPFFRRKQSNMACANRGVATTVVTSYFIPNRVHEFVRDDTGTVQGWRFSDEGEVLVSPTSLPVVYDSSASFEDQELMSSFRLAFGNDSATSGTRVAMLMQPGATHWIQWHRTWRGIRNKQDGGCRYMGVRPAAPGFFGDLHHPHITMRVRGLEAAFMACDGLVTRRRLLTVTRIEPAGELRVRATVASEITIHGANFPFFSVQCAMYRILVDGKSVCAPVAGGCTPTTIRCTLQFSQAYSGNVEVQWDRVEPQTDHYASTTCNHSTACRIVAFLEPLTLTDLTQRAAGDPGLTMIAFRSPEAQRLVGINGIVSVYLYAVGRDATVDLPRFTSFSTQFMDDGVTFLTTLRGVAAGAFSARLFVQGIGLSPTTQPITIIPVLCDDVGHLLRVVAGDAVILEGSNLVGVRSVSINDQPCTIAFVESNRVVCHATASTRTTAASAPIAGIFEPSAAIPALPSSAPLAAAEHFHTHVTRQRYLTQVREVARAGRRTPPLSCGGGGGITASTQSFGCTISSFAYSTEWAVPFRASTSADFDMSFVDVGHLSVTRSAPVSFDPALRVGGAQWDAFVANYLTASGAVGDGFVTSIRTVETHPTRISSFSLSVMRNGTTSPTATSVIRPEANLEKLGTFQFPKIRVQTGATGDALSYQRCRATFVEVRLAQDSIMPPTPTATPTASHTRPTPSGTIVASPTVTLAATATSTVLATPSATRSPTTTHSLPLAATATSSLALTLTLTKSRSASWEVLRPRLVLVLPQSPRAISERDLVKRQIGDVVIEVALLGDDVALNCDFFRPATTEAASNAASVSPQPATPRLADPDAEDPDAKGLDPYSARLLQLTPDDEGSGLWARWRRLVDPEKIECDERRLRYVFGIDAGLQFAASKNITFAIAGFHSMAVRPTRPQTVVATIDMTELEASPVLAKADLEPSVLTFSSATIELARRNARISSMVSALLGAPLTATQTMRTAVILNKATCEDNSKDRLDFMTHPLMISIGDPPFGQYVAAVMLNVAVVVGFCILHFAVANMQADRSAPKRHFARTRFPSLQFTVVMALLQPTVFCATTLLRKGSTDLHRGTGAAGFGVCFFYALLIMHVTIRSFGARYRSYKKRENVSLLWRFFFGGGEWVDKRFRKRAVPAAAQRRLRLKPNLTPAVAQALAEARGVASEPQWVEVKCEHFVQMFGMFFDPLREGREWFGVVEIAVTAAAGVLDGWWPEPATEACESSAAAMMALFAAYFFAVLLLRPYVSVYNNIFCFLIGAAQMSASLLIGVYHLSGTRSVVVGAEYLAVIAMNGTGLKAGIDAVLGLYCLFMLRLCRKADGETADGKGSSSSSMSDGEERRSAPSAKKSDRERSGVRVKGLSPEQSERLGLLLDLLAPPGGGSGASGGDASSAALLESLLHLQKQKGGSSHLSPSPPPDDAHAQPLLTVHNDSFEGLPLPTAASSPISVRRVEGSRRQLQQHQRSRSSPSPPMPFKYIADSRALEAEDAIEIDDGGNGSGAKIVVIVSDPTPSIHSQPSSEEEEAGTDTVRNPLAAAAPRWHSVSPPKRSSRPRNAAGDILADDKTYAFDDLPQPWVRNLSP